MRKWMISGLAVAMTTIGFGQKYKIMMEDPSVNFYDVVKEADRYFENRDKGKGSGFVNYQRWKYENESKYYPSGNREGISPTFAYDQFESFIAKNPSSAKRGSRNPWQEWGPVTIETITGHYNPGMGRIETFYIDRVNTDRMFLGSRSGGFWRTYDGGANWENTTDFLPASGVNTMSVSPHNSDRILINVRNGGNGYSHGIYKSEDDGATWAVTEFGPDNLIGGLGKNFVVYKVAFHPSIANLVFVTTNQGVYRSTDTLNTWLRVHPRSSNEIEFHPTNDSIVYIFDRTSANRDAIQISTDLGLTFIASGTMTGQSSSSPSLDVSPDCPDCVYLGSSQGIWKSTDKGANFTFVSSPSQTGRYLVVSDTDDRYMISGGIDAFVSNNGGQTFTQSTWWSLGSVPFDDGQYIHADLREGDCIDGKFYLATDGYLAVTADNGASWTNLSKTVGIRENYSLGLCQANAEMNYLGSQDNGQSLRNDTSWLELYGADGMEGVIQSLNADWIMGSWQYGGRRVYFDGGMNGRNVTPPGQANGAWVAPLIADPNDPMVVYSMDETLYKTEDFGEDWDNMGDPFAGSNVGQVAICENNSNIIFFSSGSNMVRSMDGGDNYDVINGLPGGSVTDIAIAPKNDSIIVITYNSYLNDNKKVYVSTDLGETWTNHTFNLGNMPVRSVVVDHTDDTRIYVGAEIGVYHKALSETSWTLYNKDLPNVTVRDIKIHRGSNSLRAATWGRGLWEVKLTDRETYPSIHHVYMSYPNDFETPKFSIENFIYADIDYAGVLADVSLLWSIDEPRFDSVMEMNLTTGNTYESARPIPEYPEGTKIFFMITAEGDAGDVSETYRFMYRVKPFDYCEAEGDNSTGADWIDYVAVNSDGHDSQKDGYGDFTNIEFDVTRGSLNVLEISLNYHWDPDTTAAWIDFNKNATFDDHELIVMSELTQYHESFGSFTVPVDAELGPTRMRVRNQYWNQSPVPCGSLTGEVEDYTVNILPAVSINERTRAFGLKVYPNPSSGVVHISMDGLKAVNILDQQGRLILQEQMSSGSMDLNDLSSGVYFVIGVSDLGESRTKLIID